MKPKKKSKHNPDLYFASNMCSFRELHKIYDYQDTLRKVAELWTSMDVTPTKIIYDEFAGYEKEK